MQQLIIGDSVRFNGCSKEQIAWGNNTDPSVGNLVIGEWYLVEDIFVHSQHTKLKLCGIIGRYNSVCFSKDMTASPDVINFTVDVPEPPDYLMDTWTKDTYSKQRRNRLGDILNDYLGDEDVTARQFYEELLAELDEYILYHKKFHDKIAQAKSLVMGHRDVEIF